MNDTRYQLTPGIQRTICAFIRSGGFPEIAAEANGIPRQVFRRWMRFGKATRPIEKYRLFRENVMAAEAEARLFAETKTYQQSPIAWLKFGPGRTRKGRRGWAGTVRPLAEVKPEISGPPLQEFFPVLLEALEPFPEARLALVAVLEKNDFMKGEEEDSTEEMVSTGVVENEALQRTCNEDATNLHSTCNEGAGI